MNAPVAADRRIAEGPGAAAERRAGPRDHERFGSARRFRTVWLVALLLATSSSAALGGRSYYVSPEGSDRNRGSINSPWRDIESSVSRMAPGDTLYLRAGTYLPGYRIFIRKPDGGAPGAYKTIRSYQGEIAQVRKYGFLVDASYVRIENLRFVDGADVGGSDQVGAAGQERRGLQVLNCTFKGPAGWDFIGIQMDDALVEGNVIEMEGSSQGTQGHGIYLSHGSGVVIRNNVIKGHVQGYGIHVFDQRRGGDAGSFRRKIRNAVIEGNIVTGSTQRSGIIAVAYDGASIDNLMIRNNVVFGNAAHGILVGAQAANVFLYNNTIYGNGGSAIALDADYAGGTLRHVEIKNNILDVSGSRGAKHIEASASRADFTADTNLYWPGPARLSKIADAHPVVGAPAYRDPAHFDFRPRRESAAINRGLPLRDVAVDADGAARNKGPAPDIGAYESN